jgi:nucleotide-binding universal stress UspA family protein
VILIAYDGSKDAQSAIEHAGELMSGEKATVLSVWERFIDVMTRNGWGLGLAPGIVDFEGIDKASEESARERAAEGAQRAARAGLDAEPRTRARDTTIAETILSEADEVEASAIVLGTRGLTRVKSLLLGSVSHAVLQHADRPVIVVPSPQGGARAHGPPTVSDRGAEDRDDHDHHSERRLTCRRPDHGVSSLRRVGVGMVEHLERPLVLGNLDREGIAGPVVVDGDEHGPIALTPQQPNVDAVVHAAVQLAHRSQELGGHVITPASG